MQRQRTSEGLFEIIVFVDADITLDAALGTLIGTAVDDWGKRLFFDDPIGWWIFSLWG